MIDQVWELLVEEHSNLVIVLKLIGIFREKERQEQTWVNPYYFLLLLS